MRNKKQHQYPRVFDFVGVCGNRLMLTELLTVVVSVKFIFSVKLVFPVGWI